ncbi:MAG: hypothetical protein A3C85_01740 [Candidatus Doudnabacteria bacterium RIFCSPHIGHO2_02_FULL_48_21]|uniref:YibE/F family protein n=1 Tax=Candidatus Doudnabacteria bacterium RIFCSPLOWO2_02_FULL_48_13 TaxID=1817845 RepID=A0A1F5QCW7_9BACT|nr:MAG: hypothetical protein A3K05_02705 [Candidatus Doudnabacteria bacterium RIFCSPHIGHO2_01_48_18]OGE77459.1 MAG: hypothetical protein A2668_04215 [Candidatus Doudnabacteria bacterium RIFCSPHIGHO2_01_FULL_48_180]OGE91562.1 MAG: hypothetical protein A3F44_04025 [Candidatus Doudnabacteria bacterium RIFCSPHIGHO2_12_FULL_47_25]OGE93152.1 MAG: hypothetical protein A3C85_01740 [Candidatus Doudnabacteria bacterium RIFCSPHIGHO2_02_FULL_48_21]OGE97250.1 MAG: hypothetical protein A3A83_01400 [Candidatu
MKKALLIAILLLMPFGAFAQEQEEGQPLIETPVVDSLPIEKYALGKVVEILQERKSEAGGYTQLEQEIRVEILTGEEKGQTVSLVHGGAFVISDDQKVKVGEKIVLGKTEGAQGVIYFVAETFRLPWIAAIFLLFVGLVVFFARKKGFGSILGLTVSIVVLTLYVVPRILEGSDPLAASLVGALITAVISLYFAHGFSKQTSIALASTVLTLALATGIAILFVTVSRLFGLGSEEAYYLRMLQYDSIDLRGLLLGGIIIGALGVLDDITSSQTATIFELSKANPELSFPELYHSGLRVGREHIASLVNTLVLAYAGASFPLLLIFTVNKNIPIWATLNSELVAEEVIRTLVGSVTLVLAVPIATAIAAYFASHGAKRPV